MILWNWDPFPHLASLQSVHPVWCPIISCNLWSLYLTTKILPCFLSSNQVLQHKYPSNQGSQFPYLLSLLSSIEGSPPTPLLSLFPAKVVPFNSVSFQPWSPWVYMSVSQGAFSCMSASKWQRHRQIVASFGRKLTREEARWRTRFRIAAQNINNCPRINPQKRTLPHQTHGKGWWNCWGVVYNI